MAGRALSAGNRPHGVDASAGYASPVTANAPSSRRPRRHRKERSLWFKVAVRTLLGFVGLFLLAVLAFVILYIRIDIPAPNADAQKQTSIVYYADGKTEIGRIGQVNRQDVQLDQVPKYVQHAFLAAEDRNFYENQGISPTGIARALWANLRGRPEQGGSTITQQYVKNYFLSQDRSWKRKIKEAMISIKIDRKYSKDQILQDYLNNTYFGRGAYGIQAAAQTYFGVDAKDLTISQGAFLASVINAPSLYDPANGKDAADRANRRMVYVLDGMVEEGWLTKEQRADAKFPTFHKQKPPDYGTGPKSFILKDVKEHLKTSLHLTDQDIARGGLRITTTIDKHDQKAAVAAVKKNVPSQTAKINALHAGLIAQEPDGAVVAMFGGRGSAQTELNSATQARMQAGSQFKVFTLAAAVKQGIPLTQTYDGSSPLTIGNTTFQNDLHEQFGMIDLNTALAHSVNTVFLQLNQDVGPKKTLQMAQDLGIPATLPGMLKSDDPNTDINNVLGVTSVSVQDMANAYNTISTGGKRATPYIIRKVRSVASDYSYQAHPKTTRTIDESVAHDVANAMSHVLTDPGASAYATAGQLQRPAAGKTGTTDRFMAAWFTGFTPDQLTASVGMYAGAGKKAGTKPLAQAGQMFYGGAVPASIWRDFMQAALKGEPVRQLPDLSDINRHATQTAPPVTQEPTQTMEPTAPTQSPTATSPTTSPSPTTTSPSPTTTSPSPTTTSPSPTTTSPTTTAPTTTKPPHPTPPPQSPPAGGEPTANPGQRGQPGQDEAARNEE